MQEGATEPSASERAFAPGTHLHVTADALNVRATPEKKHENVLGGLQHGHKIEATGQEGSWIRIAYLGQTGYVHNHYVAEDKPAHAAAPDPAAAAVAAPHLAAAHAGATAEPHHEEHAEPIHAPAPATTPHADGTPATSTTPAPPSAPTQDAPPPTHATVSAPATAPGPDAHAVQAEYDKVLADFRAGKIDQAEAVRQFTGFAGVQHGGVLTSVGVEKLGQLMSAMAVGATAAAHLPQTSHPAAAPAPTTTTTSAETPGRTYLSNYTSLGGTNIEDLKTTKTEADILNYVRHSDRRFDPAWLAAAQGKLGVVATGAFNTETLRALLAMHPKLDGEAIVSNRADVLTPLAPGTPFIETAPGSTGEKHKEVGPTKADRAAQRLGYKDYASYQSSWGPATLLGTALNTSGSGLAHPHMLERLAVADKFLRHRHPGMKDHDIVKAIGWNASGNAAYSDNTGAGVSHFHTMGLAIDIDVAHNPYLFTGRQYINDKKDSDEDKDKKRQHNWWMDMFEKHLAFAAKIYGGEPISAAIMDRWADKMSSDELWARVHEVSQSFGEYLKLGKQSVPHIRETFANKHVSASATDIEEVKKVPGYFHDNYSRDQATSLTTHSQELLIALRDVAGLSWGGAEMSSNENGDFMHFDCRQDNFGSVLQKFNFP